MAAAERPASGSGGGGGPLTSDTAEVTAPGAGAAQQ